MVSYLVHCDTLLQNATDIIITCKSYFITKCDKSLLQNASGFLLQNATVRPTSKNCFRSAGGENILYPSGWKKYIYYGISTVPWASVIFKCMCYALLVFIQTFYMKEGTSFSRKKQLLT